MVDAGNDGAYEEKTSTEILLDGDGTKFLMDDGTYKAILTAPKIVIGKSLGQGSVSPVQGYRFSKKWPNNLTQQSGDTLINYESNWLMIGEIIRVETSYIYIYGYQHIIYPNPFST